MLTFTGGRGGCKLRFLGAVNIGAVETLLCVWRRGKKERKRQRFIDPVSTQQGHKGTSPNMHTHARTQIDRQADRQTHTHKLALTPSLPLHSSQA